jgi:4-hydroxy-2-oxoheptanedioate aldolase
MRSSRVLRQLRAGRIASCLKLNLADARVAEIAARCGIDCVWLDLEHVPNTLHDVENQVRAAKMHDTDAVVRVERGSYSDLVRPLEMDATGIIVPHVMSAEDARQIVRTTRFHPLGRRPLDGGNADGGYCAIPVERYLQQANNQRFVIVQIEDPEALAEVDAIAQIDGIDMLFFGPGDFSHALGVPGQFDHAEVRAGFTRVAQAAGRHGKFAGTAAAVDNLAQVAGLGYQFLACGADVLALRAAFGHVVAAFDQLGRRDVPGQAT